MAISVSALACACLVCYCGYSHERFRNLSSEDDTTTETENKAYPGADDEREKPLRVTIDSVSMYVDDCSSLTSGIECDMLTDIDSNG